MSAALGRPLGTAATEPAFWAARHAAHRIAAACAPTVRIPARVQLCAHANDDSSANLEDSEPDPQVCQEQRHGNSKGDDQGRVVRYGLLISQVESVLDAPGGPCSASTVSMRRGKGPPKRQARTDYDDHPFVRWSCAQWGNCLKGTVSRQLLGCDALDSPQKPSKLGLNSLDGSSRNPPNEKF